MLNERGRLIGDFTIAKLGPSASFLVGTLAASGSTSAGSSARRRPKASPCGACAAEILGFSIAGPRARELLQSLVRDDLATAPSPSSPSAEWDVRRGPGDGRADSFTGDLGYEIWCQPPIIIVASTTCCARPARNSACGCSAGARCIRCGSRSPSAPGGARVPAASTGRTRPGSGASSDLGKADFVGKDAAAAEKAKGAGAAGWLPSRSTPATPDAIGDEPVFPRRQRRSAG
jgi:dimethylglycine dehydrogenase